MESSRLNQCHKRSSLTVEGEQLSMQMTGAKRFSLVTGTFFNVPLPSGNLMKCEGSQICFHLLLPFISKEGWMTYSLNYRREVELVICPEISSAH